jgi:hypothetical protein
MSFCQTENPTTLEQEPLNRKGLYLEKGGQQVQKGGWVSSVCANPGSPPTISFNPSNPAEGHWYNTNQTLSWTISDPDSDVRGYKFAWDQNPPGGSEHSGNSGSTTLSAAGQGQHTLYVQAWDNAGNASEIASTGWFGYDISRPNPPAINAGCSAYNNQWQNTCRDPNFTWGATDSNGSSGSGIANYAYTWETDPAGNPTNWSSTTSYDPGPVAEANGAARRYLHVRARDVAGNVSPLSTFGLWYDGSTPIVTLFINNGVETTNQTGVSLNLSASDTGSGIADVRISDNGSDWSAWQPYADTLPWTLHALDRRSHTVYIQARDVAGNESAVVSDDIYLDLYPPMPHSENYRICADVVDAGGSIGGASANYSLVSAIGQPWGTGATANTSSAFGERSGFLSSITGCLPITYTITSYYTVTQWVIASGGNLRDSASYRLGDTTGQPAASGTNAFTSTNYVLSSGFWAQNTGALPPPPPPTPTPGPTDTPTPTPTPSPTPTPQPSSFGISINDEDTYTNDPVVTVRTWAPNVTRMRLSNDDAPGDEGWSNYQITTTWVLSTYTDSKVSVHAWFQGTDSNIYGPYSDEIIYDSTAPEGSVMILGGGSVTVTLWLVAHDDTSGVNQMRVGEDVDLTDVAWQPFTNTLTWVLSSPVVYAQFQDWAENLSAVYGSDGSTHTPNAQHVYLPLVLRNY